MEGVLSVRWWQPEDLPQLVDIYGECYPHENWTADDFIRVATREDGLFANSLKCLTLGNRVLGSILHQSTTGSCRVRRVAVRKRLRRRGYGTFMVRSLTKRPATVLYSAWIHSRDDVGRLFITNGPRFTFDPAVPRDRDGNGDDYYLFTKQSLPPALGPGKDML